MKFEEFITESEKKQTPKYIQDDTKIAATDGFDHPYVEYSGKVKKQGDQYTVTVKLEFRELKATADTRLDVVNDIVHQMTRSHHFEYGFEYKWIPRGKDGGEILFRGDL